jgi:hypothetical protein
MEKNSSGVLCSVHGHPAIEPLLKKLTEKHFMGHIQATGKMAKPQKKKGCT